MRKPLPVVIECLLNLWLLLLFGLLSLPSFSQNKNGDSISAVYSAMYGRYMNGIGGASALYSGAEYEGAYPRVLGSPFWNSDDFKPGTVCYEGIAYYNVSLAYDLVRNEVIVKGFQQLSMRLERGKVNYFILAGHTYLHLTDSVGKNSPPDDFYDLLYKGEVWAFAKRTKAITKAFTAEGQDTITGRTSYFLRKDSAYYSVDNPNDLLKVLSGDKNALKSFWKEQKLNFKKEPETFITQTLYHWEQLKK